ncbi:5-formyltetrahydrofolate cyclo-ligase [Luteimonas sp. e5]
MSLPSPNRAELRMRRRAIEPPARMLAAEMVAQRLLELPDAPISGHVAGYWAMDGELPLHVWQLRLPAACVYCLPVLDTHAQILRFAPWRPGDALVSNRYGIPEPEITPDTLLDAREMAMIALPLTGFDRHARRLGMGGGWYDRTLAFRSEQPAPPLAIGVGFDLQEVSEIVAEPWDIACDAIVTETRTLHRAPA